MIEYDKLPKNIKDELKECVSSDPYGLKPETLYKNILHRSGDSNKLVKIFEVSITLVKDIKEVNSITHN